MNISAYNKEGKERELEYVMTYSPRHPEKSRNISFPLALENSDAEAMLHAIGQLAQKPEVKELLEKLIYGYQKDGDLLWLVNNVTSECKSVTIVWNEISCFLHFRDSIAVDCGPWQFQFPDECSFTKVYKEAFDEGLFQDEEKGVGLPVEQFYIAAANDIPEILAPYITVFVRAQEYEHLCKKLKAFCHLIEGTLQTTLFNFSEKVPPYEIYLVNLFRKNATLYTEDSFYPDVKPSYPNEFCLLPSNHL